MGPSEIVFDLNSLKCKDGPWDTIQKNLHAFCTKKKVFGFVICFKVVALEGYGYLDIDVVMVDPPSMIVCTFDLTQSYA